MHNITYDKHELRLFVTYVPLRGGIASKWHLLKNSHLFIFHIFPSIRALPQRPGEGLKGSRLMPDAFEGTENAPARNSQAIASLVPGTIFVGFSFF